MFDPGTWRAICALKSENDQLITTLEFYAQKHNYTPTRIHCGEYEEEIVFVTTPIERDQGAKARKMLGGK